MEKSSESTTNPESIEKVKTGNWAIPLVFTLLGLALVLLSNNVTRFNKEKFFFKENDTLASIRSTLPDPANFWNGVTRYVEANYAKAKNLTLAKSRYFERKLEVGVFAVLTAFLLIMLLIISNAILYKNTSELKWKWVIRGICWLVPFIFAVVLWCCNPITESGPVDYLSGLIEKYGDGTTVRVIGGGVASLAGGAVAGLVFACCSLLHRRDNTSTTMHQAKLLLGISSVTLASGVLLNYFFHTWSAAIVEDGKQVIALGNILTIHVGILFTFLLLLLFIPIALFHQAWARDGNETAGQKGEAAVEWKDVIREILTALIPIIVAVVAQWLGYKDS